MVFDHEAGFLIMIMPSCPGRHDLQGSKFQEMKIVTYNFVLVARMVNKEGNFVHSSEKKHPDVLF